ncbi:flagellar hook-associated protein FlgK [Fodinicurvata sp. EGI_FJ10296]|uniref:flagellar hook-associated protein FlgK n=1 Tax=Fodinicurvata sp. EGI_FJ10296 TaxID=3231908 RepID=UPI00345541B0
MSILNNASSGLKTAQSLLNTTSRNVTNASTPGYTKKTQHSSTGPLGNAEPGKITRAVNEFLVQDLRRATSADTYQDTLTAALKYMDALSGDPAAEASLGNRMDALGNAFQDVATEPSSSVAYAAVIESGTGLADSMNRLYSDMQSVRFEARQDRSVDVGVANEILGEIADLNIKISDGLAAGRDVTDRQDRRDQLALELSEIMEIRTFENDRGVMNVFTAEYQQLANDRAKTITVDSNDRILVSDEPVSRLGGTLGAYNEIERRAVDRLAELDEMATQLASAFSENGGPETDMFVDAAGNTPEDGGFDSAGFAAGISVRQDLIDNPTHLRTSRADIGLGNENAVGDTTVLNQSRQALLQPRDFDLGANETYRGVFKPALTSVTLSNAAAEVTASIGDQVRRSEGLLSESSVSVGFLKNELATTADVNIDDEMARMIVLQQLYSASARVITTTQRMMDELMNSVR